jgi:hypothetical protein
VTSITQFQYPALIRSKRYDSSSSEPDRDCCTRALERVFGGRFANLAMNAGLAYEQYRLSALLLGGEGPANARSASTRVVR